LLSVLPSVSDSLSKSNLSMTLMDTIVGFQSGHDVSYCLLKNGKPLIHEELERFTRVKEELGDGLKFFFENSSKELQKQSKFFTLGNFGGRDKKKWPKCNDPNSQSLMNLIIDNNQGKYFELSHHMCHAANAFFSSNFDKSLILTIDGGGLEDKNILTASTFYMGEGTKIKKIKVYDYYKFNIAVCWNFVAQIFGLSIGYPKGNQAGTVMAMASMSNSTKYVEPLMDMMTKKKDIQSYFLDYKETAKRIFNKLQFSEKEKFDIASSLQIASENLVKEELNFFVKKFKPKKLCVAGGCALNSVLIGKIQNWFPQIENVYVPPVPYDSGLAIGSAQFLWHQILGNKRIKWKDNFTPYLGRKYNENDIKKALKKFKDFITFYKDDDEKVLKLLDDQQIVSVFGGGSESGRRALGNRSIIADPRNEKMKEIINKKVKHRQWFRPFAPSILKEKVTDWFERDVSSPYMTHVIKWKKDKRKLVPAVVHFDGSARLQTVSKNDNFWYYNFIKKWEKKTGVPIILNTSFNDSEPIVESPEDAIRCFLKTNIDHLYFFDYQILVSKK
jgi:carbamoyltransferase